MTATPASRMIDGAGVRLAVRETGSGPAVLMLHDLGDTAAAAEPLVAALADGAGRVVAHDRRGYGASEAPEPYQRTTVQEQAEDAATVIAQLALAPATLVGDGFGALMALDLVQRHGELVRDAVLIDPPLLMLVPEATEALSEQRLALEADLREAGAAEAAARHLARAGAPPERIERARAHPRAFFADYAGLATLPVSRRELRAIATPIALVSRPQAPAHIRAATDALAALLPTPAAPVAPAVLAALGGAATPPS